MQSLEQGTLASACAPPQTWPSWLGGSLGLCLLVGAAYFLAARLSLDLLTKPDGVAAFWPAAGVASGTLIALGSGARAPTAIGVMAATVVANLLADRNIPGAIVFAACNAGEAILIGYLITRQFGGAFSLDSVQRVLVFFLGVGIGAGVSGIGGSAGFALFHGSDASLLATWGNWFASDALGSILVAPVLIGLGGLQREMPGRWEVAQGALTLAALALVIATAFSIAADSWYTILPLGLLLPMLLAAHCRPVFAAAAALILGFGVIWMATFSVGEPDARAYLHDHVYAARATLLAISICTLILAALFAERRQNEAALTDGNERLQLALDAAELGVWSIDAKSGRFYSDVRDRRIHGHPLTSPPVTLAQARGVVHPDDLKRLDDAFAVSRRAGGSCKAEYRLAPRLPGELGKERWVAVEGMVVRDAAGEPLRWLGVTRDVSHPKRAERALAERDAQLALAGRVALVGSFTFDLGTGMMQVSQGYAAIHDLPEASLETERSAWRMRVHPDDLPRLDLHLKQAIAERRRDHYCEYRIFGKRGDIRWIESRSLIAYDQDGVAQRIIGTNIDVTQRKQTEAALGQSEARLLDALAAGRVIAFEWTASTGQSRRSANAAAILGPETEASAQSGNDFFRQVHPDDRDEFRAHVRRLSPEHPAYALCFRFCRRDGREVWLEEEARGEFDSEGRLLRVKGLTRDISERKRAELALAERTLQLTLAGKAALVGSYSYEIGTDTLQVSEGYAALHGLPEGTTETSQREWRALVHAEDLERAEAWWERAFREQRREYELEYRIVRGGEVRWIESRSFISYAGDGSPQRVVGVNIDVTERKQAEEHRNILNAELDHRVKNVLATVGAIVRHTQHSTPAMADFVTALEQRIESLAGTHELLSHSNWRGVSLAEVVAREFAPYAGDNAEVSGPSVTLKAEAAQAVAMVLHELTTNSAKYGAFSTQDGRVRLRWRWWQKGATEPLVVDWQEIGGPEVVTRPRSGYGMSIIRELIPFELGGTVDLAFAREGLRCSLEIPADWANRAGALGSEPQRAVGELPWQLLLSRQHIAQALKDFC
jgi:PAS domain S-box-containing protein